MEILLTPKGKTKEIVLKTQSGYGRNRFHFQVALLFLGAYGLGIYCTSKPGSEIT